MVRILVVEDGLKVNKLVCTVLKRAGGIERSRTSWYKEPRRRTSEIILIKCGPFISKESPGQASLFKHWKRALFVDAL